MLDFLFTIFIFVVLLFLSYRFGKVILGTIGWFLGLILTLIHERSGR